MSQFGSGNRRKHWWRVLSIGQKKLLFLGLLLLIAVIPVLVVLISYSYRAAQYDIETVVAGEPVTALYGHDNQFISVLPNVRYIAVKWEELPPLLINAFVAREDESFFEHHGIVYSSVIRSVLRNISSMRYEQGASTITMQLTRNVFEMQDKTLDRKLLEAFVARRIESRYSKETIFEQYVNRIYFGQNCYGVGAAAAYYFGKHVKDLTLSECAVLAGLVRGPSIFNPRSNMESAKVVKQETLQRMLELEFISQAEYDAAMAEPIVLADADNVAVMDQSYLHQWVARELSQMNQAVDERSVGMAVVSTFDLGMQQYVEESAERALVMVENRLSPYPETWEPFSPTPEHLAAAKKAFSSTKRPEGFKVRGESNQFDGLLQCCVLVVDARPNHAGEIMAVSSGRGVSDGINRWTDKPILPGRNAAPILFCAAGLQNNEHSYILTNDVVTTGANTGYDNVAAFIRSLVPGIQLPPAEQAQELYLGRFPMLRIDLARVLFSIQNGGRGYDFYAVNKVWSRARLPLFQRERNVNPEWIQRQSAATVASLSPFVSKDDNKLIILSEKVEDNGGYWTMVSNPNGVAVFVWMGFDSNTTPGADSADLNALIQRASIMLARELHAEARTRLKERSENK